MRNFAPVALLFLLGACLFAQTSVFEITKKKAEQGDVAAQRDLAWMYRFGKDGASQNIGESVKWMRKAANAGDASAQTGLGLAYSSGGGVPQSHAEAVRWYRKAAEQGYSIAEHYLGMAYLEGRGVAQRPGEAFKWFRSAAMRGDNNSQNMLGEMYAKGRGVQKDEVEALAWLSHGNYKNESTIRLKQSLEAKLGPDQLGRAAKRWDQIRAETALKAGEKSEPKASPNGNSQAK